MDEGLAGLAGVIIGGAIGLGSAWLQERFAPGREVAAERRRHNVEIAHLSTVLIGELEALKARARQVRGAVIANKAAGKDAAEARARCFFEIPAGIESSAIGLLSAETREEISGLITAVRGHNDLIGRITHGFGDENTADAVVNNADAVASIAHTIAGHLRERIP